MACEQCQSTVEITDLPHVIRKCTGCGRELHIVEPGAHGIGIKVRKGDRFIFPSGWLKLAFNPLKSTGHFTRAGLQFFADMIFVNRLTHKRDQYEHELEDIIKYSEKILDASPLTSNVVVESEEDAKNLIDTLGKDRQKIEWWAYLTLIFASGCNQAIEENNAKEAAWAAACTERLRAMVLFKEHLEEVIWMGHSAKRIIDAINKWGSNKNNSDERFWQKTFEDSPYVISQAFAAPVVFLRGNVYVGGMKLDRKDAKYADLLYSAETSSDAIIVEIKAPTTELLAKSKYRGIYRPSSELAGATVQVLDYRREIEKGLPRLVDGLDFSLNAFNPRCLIVVGNAGHEFSSDLHRRSFELFRRNLKDVEIITYDELFKKLELLAQLFNLVRRQSATSEK